MLPPADNNESLSDSVAKVLAYYDQKLQEWRVPSTDLGTRIARFWRENIADNQGISDLRKINRYPAGVLGDGRVLHDLKGAIERRKIRNPSDDDVLTKEIFQYLDARIKHAERRQRRAATEVTADYKILLVGNGWAQHLQPNNPAVKQSQSNNGLTKEVQEKSLNIERLGYKPNQVFTIDIDPGRLPDITSPIQNIAEGELPENFFNCVYFEGMRLDSDENYKKAINIALTSLKDDGVFLYYSEDSHLRLVAKSGELNPEKIAAIPQCVKDSVNLQLSLRDFPLLEEIAMNGEKELDLTPGNTFSRYHHN